MNILSRILRFQEQKLSNDQVGADVRNLLAQENDSVLQKSGINVVASLAAAGLFNDIGTKLISKNLLSGNFRRQMSLTPL